MINTNSNNTKKKEKHPLLFTKTNNLAAFCKKITTALKYY